jgi:hypothetical protein
LAQRASVGSTEASNGHLARVGVLGPKRARLAVWRHAELGRIAISNREFKLIN